MPEGKHVIRTSDRATFRNCRLRWDFTSKERRNLIPLSTDRALNFGTAIHGGLEVFYDPTSWPASKLIPELAIAEFNKLMPKPKPDDYELQQQWEDDMMLGAQMLMNYFEHFKNDGWKPVLVEQEFEIELFTCSCHGWPVVYQGRVDLVVEVDGELWCVDHKTTKSLSDILDFLQIENQCGSYVWALNKLGIPVKGIIYNELAKEVPKPPKVLKSGMLSTDKRQVTTFQIYHSTILELGQDPSQYAEMLEYLREHPREFFRRTRVRRNATHLQAIEIIIQREATDMLEPMIYPNPDRIRCSRCEFKQPCLAWCEGSDVDYILNDLYMVREDV